MSLDDGITKELECIICGSIMVDPRVLTCQHAFCLKCIFGVAQRNRSPGLSIKCPFGCAELTETTQDVRSLKKNHLIHNLCHAYRKKLFDAGQIDACDWCDGMSMQRSMSAEWRQNSASLLAGHEESGNLMGSGERTGSSTLRGRVHSGPDEGGYVSEAENLNSQERLEEDPQTPPSGACRDEAKEEEKEEDSEEETKESRSSQGRRSVGKESGNSKESRKIDDDEEEELSEEEQPESTTTSSSDHRPSSRGSRGRGSPRRLGASGRRASSQPTSARGEASSGGSAAAAADSKSPPSSPHKKVSFCAKCSGVLCKTCMESVDCDHSFLCKPVEVVSSLVDMRKLSFYLVETQAGALLIEHMKKKRNMTPVIQQCVAAYVRFFSFEVTCRGTLQNRPLQFKSTVYAAAKGDFQAFEVGDVEQTFSNPHIWDDLSLSILYEVQSAVERMSKVARQIAKLLESLKSGICISLSPNELSLCLHVLLTVCQLLYIERLCIRPAAQKLALVASVFSILEAEKMQAAIERLPQGSVERRTLHRLLVNQQRLSADHSSRLLHQNEGATERILKIAATTQELTRNLAARIGMCTDTNGDSMERWPPNRRSLLPDAASVLADLLGMSQHVMSVKARLEKSYKKHFELMQPVLRNAAPDVVSSVVEGEQAVVGDSHQILSLMAGAQTLHMLWAQGAVVLGPVFEAAQMQDMHRDSVLAFDLSIFSESSEVSFLNPQIQVIRQQHLDLLIRTPDVMQEHRSLQEQMQMLMLHTMQLFQREQIVKQREYLSKLRVETVGFAHRFFASLRRHNESAMRSSPSEEEEEEKGEGQEKETKVVIELPNESAVEEKLGPSLKKVGVQLNELSSEKLTPRIIGYARVTNVISNEFCQSVDASDEEKKANNSGNDEKSKDNNNGRGNGAKTPAAAAGESHANSSKDDDPLPVVVNLFGVDEPRPLSTLPHSTVCPDLQAVVYKGAYAPEIKTRAEELGKLKFKAEFPEAKLVNLTAAPAKIKQILIPFFIGKYNIENQSGDFLFAVEAQTGEVYPQLPPLTGLSRLKDTLMTNMKSPFRMILFNTALMSAIWTAETAVWVVKQVKDNKL